ncbi:ABC transporter sub-family G-like protein 1, partial [Leptotrombidium deliense]
MSAMSEFSLEENNSQENDFEIIWEDVKFIVNNSIFTRLGKRLQGLKGVPKKMTILHGINGRIRSGELMALMGPSGAGKTTLMESIVGKREYGKSGDVHIYGRNLRNVKVSFIAQHNFFLKYLTVRETILFATKIHSANKLLESTLEPLFDENGNALNIKLAGNEYCARVTDKIIADLGLN